MTQAEYRAYLSGRLQPAQEHADTFHTEEHHTRDLEGVLHDDILGECKQRGWIAVHSRMDKRATNNLGTPDFIILADNGVLLMVEAKNKKSKLSVAQQGFAAWARKLGHEVHVVRCLDDFLEVARTCETDLQRCAKGMRSLRDATAETDWGKGVKQGLNIALNILGEKSK